MPFLEGCQKISVIINRKILEVSYVILTSLNSKDPSLHTLTNVSLAYFKSSSLDFYIDITLCILAKHHFLLLDFSKAIEDNKSFYK